MDRTSYAVKNTKWGIVARVISLALGFISRTVFIYILGREYLGINGLYGELLSVLSFAELGFGTAMIFSMYAPVSAGDNEMIKKLMTYYRKVYRTISFVILGIGLVLLPFLPYLVKGADSMSLFDLRLYYCIFLFNTFSTYLVTYKYCLPHAKQQSYIITNIDMVTNIVISTVQVLAILLFKNFLVYLLVQSVLSLTSKTIVSFYMDRRFPIIKERAAVPLTKEEKAPIFKNVRGLAFHQFASIAIQSTDNIIISSLTSMGIIVVGMVGNYNMLITSVLSFVTIIFASVAPGFGNLVATSTTENYRKTFGEMNFLSFWLYGFCCTAFFVLVPPFIRLWIGEQNLIDGTSFSLIVINCFIVGQSAIYNNARIAKGELDRDKWLSFAQAIINLSVSIVLANLLGLVGVYIGTIASRLFFLISRPLATYKFLFDKSPSEYFKKTAIYISASIATCAVTYAAAAPLLRSLNVGRFILACFIVLILPNAIFFLLFRKQEEFGSLVWRIKNFLPASRFGGVVARVTNSRFAARLGGVATRARAVLHSFSSAAIAASRAIGGAVGRMIGRFRR
jgi:O-antigen/teichoic acid export membrane protein